MDFKIRPWHINDLDSLVMHANNPRVAQFMKDVFPHPYTEEAGRKFISFATSGNSVHIFAIEVEGYAAGGIGIHQQEDIYKKNAEIGYWLGEQYWNKGIISKALNEVVKIAFDQFDITRVFASSFIHNIASQKVLEKAGFQLEAVLKNSIFKNEVYYDELIYTKFKT
ncbi:MAG: GNAT family N-acetyltransferase [Chitinophagaceae bacterium]